MLGFDTDAAKLKALDEGRSYIERITSAAIAAARGKSVKDSRVLVLGVAYKKNVDQMRESPGVELMELLVARGAAVEHSDPHAPMFLRLRAHRFDLKSVALTPEALGSSDAALLAINHDAFDYALIKQHARLIVDTRGVYLEPATNVVEA